MLCVVSRPHPLGRYKAEWSEKQPLIEGIALHEGMRLASDSALPYCLSGLVNFGSSEAPS